MAIEVRGLSPLMEVFDMPTSLAFYRDKLGFEVTGDSGQGDESGWVMLQLGGATIMLNTAYDVASWSHDGRTIAFANDKEDMRTGNFEIFAIEPETANAEQRLTFRGKYDIDPQFSPDGKRIAFVTNTDGNWEIYLMNSDGTGLLRLTRNTAVDTHPAWSPDGKRIIFSSDRDGRSALYEIVLD